MNKTIRQRIRENDQKKKTRKRKENWTSNNEKEILITDRQNGSKKKKKRNERDNRKKKMVLKCKRNHSNKENTWEKIDRNYINFKRPKTKKNKQILKKERKKKISKLKRIN